MTRSVQLFYKRPVSTESNPAEPTLPQRLGYVAAELYEQAYELRNRQDIRSRIGVIIYLRLVRLVLLLIELAETFAAGGPATLSHAATGTTRGNSAATGARSANPGDAYVNAEARATTPYPHHASARRRRQHQGSAAPKHRASQSAPRTAGRTVQPPASSRCVCRRGPSGFDSPPPPSSPRPDRGGNLLSIRKPKAKNGLLPARFRTPCSFRYRNGPSNREKARYPACPWWA